MLEDFALSPNGQVIAFQFLASPTGHRGLGLYEWQTGKLTRIPNPLGNQLKAPRFSYDGKRLAVVIQKLSDGLTSDIAVVDLTSLQVTQITNGDRTLFRGKTFPVFQPDTNNILYVERSADVPAHLKVVNIMTHADSILLWEKDGFASTIFRPYFVASEEIYFQAIGPVNKDLQKSVTALGASSGGTTITYRLKFGAKPEVLFPEMEGARPRPQVPIMYSFAASRCGATMICIAGIGLGNQLFKIEYGHELKQLTNLNGLPAYSTISYDGSMIAFGLDPEFGKNFDLQVMDIKKQTLHSGNLLDKINNDADFIGSG